MRKHKSKVIAAGLSAVLAGATLLGGSFAWQSISQTGKNEVMGDPNPGGRLHDDFNGENKDIYVENFTDLENGTPIFARIRLYEYMELGEGAGDPNAQGRGTDIQVIGKSAADFDDPTTWAIHYLDQEDAMASTEHLTFHDYVTWDEDGGSTVYMPTFNKNKDSLLIDQNGTLEGPDGLRPSDVGDGKDEYQDYKSYVAGQTATGNAIYDADDDPTDEVGDDLLPDGAGVKVDGSSSAVLNTDYTLTNETHTAQKTQDCTVITMAEWKAKPDNEKVGNYWVYDTDGWAYWAAPIMPGTATGLLLDGLNISEPDQEWYYAINVVAQFSTAHDWGTQDKNDGFFGNGGMQEDGESVLDMAAESLNNKLTISINNTVEDIATVDSFVAQPGDKARFSVSARINGVTKQLSSTELGDVKWNIVGGNVGASSIQSPYKYSATIDQTVYNCDDDSALLTLDKAVPADTTLTVTAEYKGMTDQIEVQVENLDYDDLSRVIPGSLTTVTIDNIGWYVLVKDQDKVLLWSEDSVGTSVWYATGIHGNWEGSDVRSYLQTTFWNRLTTLKQTSVVEPTTLTSWDGRGYNPSNWKATTDKVFLLTEADLFGWASDYDTDGLGAYARRNVQTEDYTYCVSGKGQVIAPDVEFRRYTLDDDKACALRHNGGVTSGVDIVTAYPYSGVTSSTATISYYIRAIRPAMWVNLPTETP